jgi:putative ABC transport system substrate-binding protein
MRRRNFLAAALLAPLAAGAQRPGRVVRIGFLSSGKTSGVVNGLPDNRLLAAFAQRLQDLGYTVGTNLKFDLRYSDGNLVRLHALAAELAALKVDAILAAGNPAVDAARRATSTIPIVMLSADPVAAGLVPSLARPGGNLTGLVMDAGLAIWGKRLQLLKDCAPAIKQVGVLSRTAGRQGAWVAPLDAAASHLGVRVVHAGVRHAKDFSTAFSAMGVAQIDALLASDTPLYFQYRHLIIEFASQQRLPAVYAYRECAEDGGLLAYGVDLTAIYRKAAIYVDRILDGAKPADLPIEQPNTFELVVNLGTAKILGLTIPQSVLLRADRVIE